MILVDTSVWIDFLRGKKPLSDQLQILIENKEVLTTAAVFGELLQGAKGKRELEILQLYWEYLPRAEVDLVAAGQLAQASQLSSKGVGLIDASLLLTAQNEAAKLWTFDKKLAKIAEEMGLAV